MALPKPYPPTLIDFTHWNTIVDAITANQGAISVQAYNDMDYIIFYNAGAGEYQAKNCTTGVIDYNNADFRTMIQALLNAELPDVSLFFKRGVYPLDWVWGGPNFEIGITVSDGGGVGTADNLVMVGENRDDTIIRIEEVYTGPVLGDPFGTAKKHLLYVSGSTGQTVRGHTYENLTFDSRQNGYMIHADNCSDLTIRNCRFRNARDYMSLYIRSSFGETANASNIQFHSNIVEWQYGGTVTRWDMMGGGDVRHMMVQNCIFRDYQITAPHVARGSGLTSAGGTFSFNILGCVFYFVGNAMAMDGGTNYHVDDCYVQADGYGFVGWGDASNQVAKSIIENSFFYTGDSAIYWTSLATGQTEGHYNKVLNNHIEVDSVNPAVYMQVIDTDHLKIADNYIQNIGAGGIGISIDPSTSSYVIHINNNSIYAPNDYGILVGDSVEVIPSFNVIEATDGIRLYGCEYSQAEHNNIYIGGDYGVRFDTVTTRSSIESNMIRGSTTAAVSIGDAASTRNSVNLNKMRTFAVGDYIWVHAGALPSTKIAHNEELDT